MSDPLHVHTKTESITVADLCGQIDAASAKAMAIKAERDSLREQVKYLSRFHPSYNTPNWCSICTPKGRGFCACEIACNE